MDYSQYHDVIMQFDKITSAIDDLKSNNDSNTKTTEETIEEIRTAFYHQLTAKTEWGRNEVKALFEAAVESASQ